MKLEEIKEHWQKVAEKYPAEGGITPTSRDPYLGQLEEENIISFLEKKHIALEIGCGDGYHTMKYAKRVASLCGVDFTKSFIDIAKKREISDDVKNIEYVITSILDIEKVFCKRQFDCIISQRCLINLSEWRYQKNVILQLCNVLKKGGLLLLSEGFQGERENLSIHRQNNGLPKLEDTSYNRNMIRKEFESFVNQYFDIVEIRDYGTYLFLSRVLHPLVVLPNKPKHDSYINKVAMEISKTVQFSGSDNYSYNLFYVLKKK